MSGLYLISCLMNPNDLKLNDIYRMQPYTCHDPFTAWPLFQFAFLVLGNVRCARDQVQCGCSRVSTRHDPRLEAATMQRPPANQKSIIAENWYLILVTHHQVCSTLQLQPSHSSKTRPKSLDGLENVDPLAGQKADLRIGMESKELWHLWWEAFLNEPGHKMAQTPPTTNMQTFFSENMKKGSMSTQNMKFWCIQKVDESGTSCLPLPLLGKAASMQVRVYFKPSSFWYELYSILDASGDLKPGAKLMLDNSSGITKVNK